VPAVLSPVALNEIYCSLQLAELRLMLSLLHLAGGVSCVDLAAATPNPSASAAHPLLLTSAREQFLSQAIAAHGTFATSNLEKSLL
jgi:hypothetical protein